MAPQEFGWGLSVSVNLLGERGFTKPVAGAVFLGSLQKVQIAQTLSLRAARSTCEGPPRSTWWGSVAVLQLDCYGWDGALLDAGELKLPKILDM